MNMDLNNQIIKELRKIIFNDVKLLTYLKNQHNIHTKKPVTQLSYEITGYAIKVHKAL